MQTEDKQKKITFQRIYYPDTSNKEFQDMNAREFEKYMKAIMKDLLKNFNLAKRNYLQKYQFKGKVDANAKL